jgi:hypothetical protein
VQQISWQYLSFIKSGTSATDLVTVFKSCLTVYLLLFPSLQLKLKRRFHTSNNYIYRKKKLPFLEKRKVFENRVVDSFKDLFRKVPEVIEENQGSLHQSRE